MRRAPTPHPPGGTRLLGALLAALSLVGVPPSSADPDEPGSKAERLAGLETEADRLIKRGQIFDAISTLEAAVELAPERFDLRLRLAGLEKKRGMWLRSAKQYRAVMEADPKHVDARLGYAELLLADYQFKVAATEFRTLIEQKPPHNENDRALAGLGSSLFGMERFKEAGEVFDLLLADHPDNPTAQAYRNLVLRRLGDLDGAVEGWRRYLELKPGVGRAEALKAEAEILRSTLIRQRKAVEAEPDDAKAHLILGDHLREKPDPSAALSEYEKAAGLAPDDPEALIRYATSLRDEGRCAEAVKPLRALATHAAYQAVAGYNLAHCGRQSGDQDVEIEGWNLVLEINRTDRFAYGKYVDALGRAGKVEDEARLLMRAIEKRPADPLPRLQYGILAGEMGRRGDGIRALLDALTLEPNLSHAVGELSRALTIHPEPREGLLEEIDATAAGAGEAATLFRKVSLHSVWGESRKAAELLAPYVEGHPEDAKAAVALALHLRNAGRPASEVLPILERARDAHPDYFYARLDLAKVLDSLGRFGEAAAEARAALKAQPDNPLAYAMLGAALRNAGDAASLQEAYSALDRAVRLDPMDGAGVARFMLAKVAWQLGREREARWTLRGELPVDPEDMYQIAWETLRSRYRDRRFNGQNWNEWRDRFRGTLETRIDALSAISVMLASLDDRDTRLRAYDQTSNMFFTMRSVDLERDPQGRAELSSRTIQTATLEENVGYVAVSNMADPKLVKEMESAVSQMDKRDALILDLRGNLGGAEREVDQVTAMLVPSGTPTGSTVTPGGRMERTAESEKAPVLPDMPIVVLVDENTASSAELMAGSLKESKRAVVVGERTYGKAGVQFPRLLPDGTTLLVAVAESADLSGRSYAGVGIEPDVEISGTEISADPGKDPAVIKAREILRKARDQRRGDLERQEKLEREKPE